MLAPDALRDLVEGYLAELALTPELGRQQESMRYALEGGKRIRGVICLGVAESAGGDVVAALPAAGALELVHAFSLVHDDMPALDDDGERRGRPSTHVVFGEGVALLAGDALLAEAFRLALSYATPAARPRAGPGDARDDRRPASRHHGRRRRSRGAAPPQDGQAVRGSGRSWAVGRERDEPAQRPWRLFGEELGLLFQIVDDVLDGDGYAARLGNDAARRLAGEAAERARDRLAAIPADTSVLQQLVDGLAVRTA